MATPIKVGKEVKEIELLDLFTPADGEITQYYGRIGCGKTYAGTMDVLDELARGHVVYTNWRINYNGFDQRDSILYTLGSLLFPWKKRFYYFPKENLRYIEIDEHFHEKFAQLTDCSVYLDEGHVVFDSYEMAKMDIAKRKAVLHTRHFNRSIHIISQRFTAIHVTMRENVNRYYKCEKLIDYPFKLFRRTEYQDLVDGNIDEDQPVSTKLYRGKAKIYKMYDSKYLRGDTPDSQHVAFKAYDLNIIERIYALFRALARGFSRR